MGPKVWPFLNLSGLAEFPVPPSAPLPRACWRRPWAGREQDAMNRWALFACYRSSPATLFGVDLSGVRVSEQGLFPEANSRLWPVSAGF